MRINDKTLIFKLPSNKLSLEVTQDGFVLRDSKTNAILVDGSLLFDECKVFPSNERVKIEKEEGDLVEFVVE